jgi:hypothetical protein
MREAPVAGWELNPEGPATPTSEAAIETETVGVAMEVAGYHIISTNAQDTYHARHGSDLLTPRSTRRRQPD